MFYRLFFITLIVAIYMTGCSDDSTTNSTTGGYTSYEYVFFDTAQYVFSAHIYAPASAMNYPEPVVNWENSLGEPFFDLNDNGVYEPEIDSFVRALDPAINQDLNRNNRYDGPMDPWTPGIPFDDLDGNGEYDPDPGEHISGYKPGLPFCDYNNNGVRDSIQPNRYGIFKWQCKQLEDDEFICQMHEMVFTGYEHVSESGSKYNIWLGENLYKAPMLITDSGLVSLINNCKLHIMRSGPINECIDEDYIGIVYGEELSLKKTILLNQSFTIDGRLYKNLVLVKFMHEFFTSEHYFSRDHGLLAIGSATGENQDYLQYDVFFDPVGTDYPALIKMSK